MGHIKKLMAYWYNFYDLGSDFLQGPPVKGLKVEISKGNTTCPLYSQSK